MTTTNINSVDFKNAKEEYFNKKIIFYFLAFLPISLILGNTIITLNILIIDLLFLFICLYQKNWSWIRNRYFYFFIIFWLYLIINSGFLANEIGGLANVSGVDSITQEKVYPKKESLTRSIGFIRFIIFIFAIQYFFSKSKKIFNRVFKYWTVIILLVLFDIIFERIFGFNILGNVSESSHRIASFFGDELVVGSFVLGFAFVCAGFLMEINKNKLIKFLSNSFFILLIICIYFSGERSNFIKAIIMGTFILFFISNNYLFVKKKYIFLIIILGIIFSTVLSKNIYLRQLQTFKSIISAKEGKLKDDKYFGIGYKKHFAHYDTAWQIFKDYPLFGVGNKKFRYVCHEDKYFNLDIKKSHVRCSNHPHQIHFEILSEQGFVGYLIIIFAIFYILFDSFKVYLREKNLVHLSSILFVATFFIPLLPSGSFFSTFNASIFWINFAIVYSFKSNA